MVLGGDLATFASSLGMLGLLYFFGIYARSAAVFDDSGLRVAYALSPSPPRWPCSAGPPAGSRVASAGPCRWSSAWASWRSGSSCCRRTTASASEEDLLLPLAICGVGAGIANACVTGPSILSVEKSRMGEAAGASSLARFAGTALAVAIGTSTYLGVGAHRLVGLPDTAGAPTAEQVADRTGVDVDSDELAMGGDVFDPGARPPRRGPARPLPGGGRARRPRRASPRR